MKSFLTGADAARLEFDAAFAAPPAVAAEENVRLLAFRAGDDVFALRLSELAGLHQGRRIVTVPSRTPGVLGMVGLRGRLVPVFSLPRLLGYAEGGEPRWLAACAGGREPIALSFEHLDGYREVPRSALLMTERTAPGSTVPRAHTAELARLGGVLVPVVSIASILETLAKKEPTP